MIPCFIINRDRLLAPKAMVEYLLTIPELEVVIIDNNSSYKPLLDWYDTNPCSVEKLTANYGNFVLWSGQNVIEGHTKPNFFEKYNCVGSQYIISDSDLDISNVPKDFLQVMQEGLRRHSWACKCGLSLEINDLPYSEIANEAMQWESNNWTLIDDKYIKCAVDTTFALCTGVGEQNDFDKNIRVNRPYTAKHITWYYSKENPPPEDEMYYTNNASRSWNHYTSRLKNVMEGKPMTEGLV